MPPIPEMPVNPDNTRRWAEHWIAAWNARNVEAVLTLFADDCRFHSPKAATLTGRGMVSGKAALRDYWTRAVAAISHLHFELESAHWDGHSRTLLIRYLARLGGTAVIAAEVFDFAPDGRVLCGTALYGAAAD
jgi:ketosteroid isomerase-like protein